MPRARPRRLTLALVVLMFLPVAGCRHDHTSDEASDVRVDLTLRPDPPVVGPTTVVVRLTASDGKPVRGATVKLEGNMNHAGMEPVFADAHETEAGRYEATLALTMGGDWFVLVKATLADGRKVSRKIDVLGVKSR